jgi:hypothetical protein
MRERTHLVWQHFEISRGALTVENMRAAFWGIVLSLLASSELSHAADAPGKGKSVVEPPQYALWWHIESDGKEVEKVTFIYGEMEVLASGPMTYYCGFGWRGGQAPTSGYSGIQQHPGLPNNVIFSVWDTSPKLLAYAAQADSSTVFFHGHPNEKEGTSCHTDAPCAWKVGAVFRFALTKRPHKSISDTLSTFYFFDEGRKKWVLEASVSSPSAADGTDRFFSGGKYSFLEQFAGKDSGPKVCIYRLWAGTAPENLVFARRARASGRWGIVKGCYCLARGGDTAVAAVVAMAPKSADDIAVASEGNAELGPVVPDRPLPKGIIDELKSLPVPKPAAEQAAAEK